MHKNDTNEPPSRLHEALAVLDPQSRRIVELWLDGLSSRDIATQLAIPERTLEVMRVRLVARVRELIAQAASDEAPDACDRPRAS